jgi:Leucine-rich repeat (LRR) protein
LSSNNLQALAAHNFRSMPALRSLSLYHNGVETVHPDSFAMLPQLEALDLSHNKVNCR